MLPSSLQARPAFVSREGDVKRNASPGTIDWRLEDCVSPCWFLRTGLTALTFARTHCLRRSRATAGHVERAYPNCALLGQLRPVPQHATLPSGAAVFIRMTPNPLEVQQQYSEACLAHIVSNAMCMAAWGALGSHVLDERCLEGLVCETSSLHGI